MPSAWGGGMTRHPQMGVAEALRPDGLAVKHRPVKILDRRFAIRAAKFGPRNRRRRFAKPSERISGTKNEGPLRGQ
jgi:hypothetical protein